jgi:hypothetical protein
MTMGTTRSSGRVNHKKESRENRRPEMSLHLYFICFLFELGRHELIPGDCSVAPHYNKGFCKRLHQEESAKSVQTLSSWPGQVLRRVNLCELGLEVNGFLADEI